MKKIFAALLAFATSVAFGATPSPISLLNPAGSSSGQAIVSTGASSAPAWGGIGVNGIAAIAANTVLANGTGSSASPTAFAMPSCSTSSSALGWTSGSGFTCNTSINASVLLGFNWAIPGAIGSTTPSTGAFTTLSASSTVSGAGFTSLLAPYAPLASPALSGTPTAPTAAVGTNTTQLATAAFVARHGPCVNILDQGGDPTATNNNDTAWTNALAAAPNTTSNACVYFPQGRYKFAGQAVFNFAASGFAHITVIGDGQDNSVLYWPSGQGMKLNYATSLNSAHVDGISFTTGTTNTGTALLLNNTATTFAAAALTTINDVSVHGSDGFGVTNYWADGILSDGVSDVNVSNCNVWGASSPAGVGIGVQTNASNIATIVFNVTACTANQLNIGFYYGNLVQGVSISQSNFTNDTDGIIVPGSQTGLDQLSVVNNQFNAVASGFNIVTNSAVPNTVISGNTFLINNSSFGVDLAASSTFSITGNTFEPNTGSPTSVNGIAVGGWVVGGGIISGNNFYNLTTGIQLISTSKNVNVQSNVYISCTTNTSNAGTGNVIGGGSP